MKITNRFSLLIVALTLGLGWAIRGSFGHEWGASWAGAMGAFALVVASSNKNWLKNAPVLAALGAVGWAVGGMSSYGIVIGYCRGTDFINVLYGYAMLAVIGGIYGFIGGGFLGLGLESTERKRPNWLNLISYMVAGAMLTWGLLVFQLEWFMTPPRSELWAAAFGASLALAWYLWSEGYHKSLRIAIYSAFGAGFGFSFGNFIQVIGLTSGTNYNWWNVMEFTLGFLGGLGMAYAVYTSKWEEEIRFTKRSNSFALVFLFIIIPIVNFNQSFTTENFVKISKLQNSFAPIDFANLQIGIGWIIMIAFSTLSFVLWKRYHNSEENQKFIRGLFLTNSLYYIFFLIIVNGLIQRGFEIGNSNTLYLPMLLLIFILTYYSKGAEVKFVKNLGKIEIMKNWKLLLSLFVISLLIITIISINIHGEFAGSHLRFK